MDFKGNQSLVWDTERSTKTRTGARPMGHQREFTPSAYELVPEKRHRCPVYVWNLFLSKRPGDMLGDDSPLFIR